MSGKAIDLTGQKFNRWEVIRELGRNANGDCLCECKCKCGEIKIVIAGNLKNGHSKSCGCLKNEQSSERFFKHGMKHTKFYIAWQRMKDRCNNTTCKKYKNYGGRGITYSGSWEWFNNFKDDMYESYLKHIEEFGEKETTLDRKEVNGNYTKENCRWQTWKEQENNKNSNHYIRYKGKTYTLSQLAEKFDINYKTLWRRLKRGWEVERAVAEPIKDMGKHKTTKGEII